MPPNDRHLSGCPTSMRQGVVDAVKLTDHQRAVLTIGERISEIRRQLAETRAESTPGVAPALTRVDWVGSDLAGLDRIRREQTVTTPEQLVMDGSAATRPETTNRSGPARPTLQLGTYNGTMPLETILAKFENCSNYYGWYARECLCYLRACLEGDAGQVLWDADTTSSADDLIALLRNRFNSVNQAELRALRRRRGDSLQFVYQEVRRLTALAFPGQSGTLWEVMERDAFLDALGDKSLRVCILEKDPMTLDEALKLACRMEAIARSPPEDDCDDCGRRRDKFARTSAEADSPRRPDLDRHIKRLETVLGEYR